MLARLVISINSDKKLNIHMGSLFQGILMEHIPTSFADYLHQDGLKPYSQYLLFSDGKWQWVINTFTHQAYEYIISPLSDPSFDSFHIKKHETEVKIIEKSVFPISKQDFSRTFYTQDSARNVHLRFLTPASFKVDGAYLFYPAIKQIVRSLISKYTYAFEEGAAIDEDMLGTIVSNTELSKYDLRSCRFSLEGVKIPSFWGDISFYLKGAQTLVNYFNLLLKFGEFSGIGIKTAIGMGALCLVGKEGKNAVGKV